jgi:hypothetical protein
MSYDKLTLGVILSNHPAQFKGELMTTTKDAILERMFGNYVGELIELNSDERRQSHGLEPLTQGQKDRWQAWVEKRLRQINSTAEAGTPVLGQ